jgi:glutamine amidotransferase
VGQITVIDYGMGNLHSVAKAVEYVADAKTKVVVSDSHAEILKADHIVFPGQGAAKDCMAQLKKHHLLEDLKDTFRNKPFFGICMGMQVLMQASKENQGVDCLGFYEGAVIPFTDALPKDHALKIPHMGWNQVKQQQNHPMWNGIEDNAHFYYVHSYFVKPINNNIIAATSHHGVEFVSALANENVFACQFHPEKSDKNGLKLLSNFVNWKP